MATFVLNAEPRDVTGRKVKQIRANGNVPGVIYGSKLKPVLVSVPRGDLEKVYRQAGGSSVVEVKVGDKTENVLIHEVHRHPVSGLYLHADFYHVRMDEKTKAVVPLVLEGAETAPVVRELDGMIITNLSEVEVEALPNDLPHEIKVDVEHLATFEDSLKVADIKPPAGVAILNDPDTNVITVQPPKTEEQLEAELAEDVEVTTADDVEVEGEEGEEGEGEEGETTEGETTEGEGGGESGGGNKEASGDDKK
jgi:large subunit ribosomal protein L25